MFKGRKTFIIAILSAALTLLKSVGTIDDHIYQTLMALLGSGALATVRSAISDLRNR